MMTQCAACVFACRVEVVIFVSSLTEYNESGTDGEGNGLRESVAVFKEVVETPVLAKSTIVLFLNKVRNARCFTCMQHFLATIH